MQLPTGKLVYRGSFNETLHGHSLKNGPVFFANNKKTARVYGPAITYKTTRTLRLFNMGNLTSVLSLLGTQVNTHIREAFLSNLANNLYRRSNVMHNRAVAQHICNSGYDGYYAPRIGHFHAEYALCSPKNFLTRVQVDNSSEGPPPRAPTKKRRSNSNGTPPRGRRMGNNW